MISNRLPLLNSKKTNNKKHIQDENTDDNRLPLVYNREKLSFGCIDGFLKMRIINSKKRSRGPISKVSTVPTERTGIYYKNEGLTSIIKIDDSQCGNKLSTKDKNAKLINVNSKSRFMPNSNVINHTENSIKHSTRLNKDNRKRFNSLNPTVKSFREVPPPKIMKRTSIRISEDKFME